TSIFCSLLMRPLRTSSAMRWYIGSERSSVLVWKTRRCLRMVLIRSLPSPMVSVGFSHWTSLPARAAITLISVCQWSGVEIITASMSDRAITSRKSFVIAQSWLSYAASTIALALRIRQPSTSQTMSTRAAGSLRYLSRFQPRPWLPTPIKPIVIFRLGASAPNTDDGMKYGSPMPVAAVRTNWRLEIPFILMWGDLVVQVLCYQAHKRILTGLVENATSVTRRRYPAANP